MKPALIDTDILSEFLRGNAKVIENVELYLREYDSLNISIISYYEILNGLLYKDARKQLARFKNFVALNTVVPLTIKSVDISASIQAELKKRGIQIGHTDTLIGGSAIENEMQLVTNNTNHFIRIKGIEIANWSK